MRNVSHTLRQLNSRSPAAVWGGCGIEQTCWRKYVSCTWLWDCINLPTSNLFLPLCICGWISDYSASCSGVLLAFFLYYSRCAPWNCNPKKTLFFFLWSSLVILFFFHSSRKANNAVLRTHGIPEYSSSKTF